MRLPSRQVVRAAAVLAFLPVCAAYPEALNFVLAGPPGPGETALLTEASPLILRNRGGGTVLRYDLHHPFEVAAVAVKWRGDAGPAAVRIATGRETGPEALEAVFPAAGLDADRWTLIDFPRRQARWIELSFTAPAPPVPGDPPRPPAEVRIYGGFVREPGGWAASPAHPLAVVQDGLPASSIVVRASPPANVLQAAAALHDAVYRMTGAHLAILTEDGLAASLPSASPRLLLVGDSSPARGYGLQIEEDPDGPDRYLIRSTERYVALIGNDAGNHRGSAYAVYDLLRRLGCGWYGPDPLWQVFPRVSTLTVPPLDLEEAAAFDMRCIGLIADRTLLDAWRLTGRVVRFHAALRDLVPRSQYAARHPDYFGPGQPCLTHPAVSRIVAERLRREMDGGEGIVSFSLTQNDNPHFCECLRCRSLGNIGARLLYFANAVSRLLSETHPGRFQLTFLAYWVAHGPPRPRIAAEPGVVVLPVNEGNHARALADPEPWWVRWFARRSNNREIAIFRGWKETGAQMGVYEWWIPGCGSAAWRRVPWYSGETALRNLRFWREEGARYVFYETGYEEGNGFPIRWPLYYTAARGLWNPGESSTEIMSEACRVLYGPAAAPMERFYLLLERAMAESRERGRIWKLPRPQKIYTPAIREEAARCLEEAAQRVGDRTILARIGEETRMWRGAVQAMAE